MPSYPLSWISLTYSFPITTFPRKGFLPSRQEFHFPSYPDLLREGQPAPLLYLILSLPVRTLSHLLLLVHTSTCSPMSGEYPPHTPIPGKMSLSPAHYLPGCSRCLLPAAPILEWCFLMCTFRLPLWENVFPQIWHWWGFTPEKADQVDSSEFGSKDPINKRAWSQKDYIVCTDHEIQVKPISVF